MVSARDLHRCCDGHAPALALIQDRGNIFGGFTPVKWKSLEPWRRKADPDLKSFAFALKNPHNFPARKVALNRKKGPNCYDSRVCESWSDTGLDDNCFSHSQTFRSEGNALRNPARLPQKWRFTRNPKGSNDRSPPENSFKKIPMIGLDCEMRSGGMDSPSKTQFCQESRERIVER
jgi:hypothetical protein